MNNAALIGHRAYWRRMARVQFQLMVLNGYQTEQAVWACLFRAYSGYTDLEDGRYA